MITKELLDKKHNEYIIKKHIINSHMHSRTSYSIFLVLNGASLIFLNYILFRRRISIFHKFQKNFVPIFVMLNLNFLIYNMYYWRIIPYVQDKICRRYMLPKFDKKKLDFGEDGNSVFY